MPWHGSAFRITDSNMKSLWCSYMVRFWASIHGRVAWPYVNNVESVSMAWKRFPRYWHGEGHWQVLRDKSEMGVTNSILPVMLFSPFCNMNVGQHHCCLTLKWATCCGTAYDNEHMSVEPHVENIWVSWQMQFNSLTPGRIESRPLNEVTKNVHITFLVILKHLHP